MVTKAAIQRMRANRALAKKIQDLEARYNAGDKSAAMEAAGMLFEEAARIENFAENIVREAKMRFAPKNNWRGHPLNSWRGQKGWND